MELDWKWLNSPRSRDTLGMFPTDLCVSYLVTAFFSRISHHQAREYFRDTMEMGLGTAQSFSIAR